VRDATDKPQGRVDERSTEEQRSQRTARQSGDDDNSSARSSQESSDDASRSQNRSRRDADQADNSSNSRQQNDRQNRNRQSDQNRNDQSGNSRDDRSNRDRDDDSGTHGGLGVSLAESRGRVLVRSVAPQSPASEAGLQAGDEIVSVDDQRIDGAQDVVDDIRDKDPGSRVSIDIRRNGEDQQVQARLRSRRDGGQRSNQMAQNQRGTRRAWSYDSADRQQSQDSGQDDRSEQRMRRSSQYEAQAGGNSGQDQNVGRQVRALQQEVSQLRQEVQQLRNQSRQGRQSSDAHDRDRDND
jgi:hypothetical protein